MKPIPYALYYDGVLVGILTNPDAYPGGISDICDALSPNEGLADAVTIPTEGVFDGTNAEIHWRFIRTALRLLGVSKSIEIDEETGQPKEANGVEDSDDDSSDVCE